MLRRTLSVFLLGLAGCQGSTHSPDPRIVEGFEYALAPADARMEWWREARFGLFIHWGLYSMLEGEWDGGTGHAEWIRTTAQIPLEEYDQLQADFNPVNYDPDAWCRLAKRAGMKYIVITTKHHDGFCLWPSAQTEFDVEGTAARRDLLGELAEAARRHGLRLGWYHSIMDWHHPDYLPRRGWESDRSSEGADFDRYVDYLRAQVTELLTDYGPIDVMWFDGEWEATWTSEYGRELYALCRELQPQVIVNNRVDKGRAGMAGLDKGPGFVGDFGTPEQEVPAGGLPGVDWETCMTMNRYWGWNRADTQWKSDAELLHTLIDVASKGGNFLLNVGPKPDGSFPPQAVERLEAMGAWMEVLGESIYGTQASPFDATFEWGRATMRRDHEGADLYLHVFDWPRTPQLIVPGLDQAGLESATLLGTDAPYPLGWQGLEQGMQLFLPKRKPHPHANVIKLRFTGSGPVVYRKPRIEAEKDRFLKATRVRLYADPGLAIHYTTDGSEPTVDSPESVGSFQLTETCTVRARSFHAGRPVSEIVERRFEKLTPLPAVELPADAQPGGLRVMRYGGSFEQVPELRFHADRPEDLGQHADLGAIPLLSKENQALEITGWIYAEQTGLYRFALTSDDGSTLRLGTSEELIVDNDGLHGAATETGVAALEQGWHPVRLVWFNATGSAALRLEWAAPMRALRPVAASELASR